MPDNNDPLSRFVGTVLQHAASGAARAVMPSDFEKRVDIALAIKVIEDRLTQTPWDHDAQSIADRLLYAIEDHRPRKHRRAKTIKATIVDEK